VVSVAIAPLITPAYPAAQSLDGPDVLDPVALQHLRDLDPGGSSKLLARIARAFETSLERLMPQLEQAIAGVDFVVIRYVSHTLKSSSASIGAVKLAQLCAQAELMASQAQIDGLLQCLERLEFEVKIVRVALQRVL
jgi:HPt (histidine-containing phosphotransfer) domain-containing protein